MLLVGCDETNSRSISYNSDLQFLNTHTDIIELRSGRTYVAVAPQWQARVMTSSSDGYNGSSYGWINRELIQSGVILDHINPFGGEERLWLGPEGGQFSIFFEKDMPFDFENWQTPALLDTEAFDLVEKSESLARFSREGRLINYSGFEFLFTLIRSIKVLDENEIMSLLDFSYKDLNVVAYSSDNTIINTGDTPWTKENGLLSVWMLGMFNPSPSTTVVIPINEGDQEDLGLAVNDNYFGPVSEDRLKIKNGLVLFKADGTKRGKIGIPPLRTKGLMGSYDSENQVITLLFCALPEGVSDYVNSAWELQDDPFSGDAYNSYNDGPLDDGSIMGPFYELESSSPALALLPGSKYSHKQTTMHISGPMPELNSLIIRLFGSELSELDISK